MGRTVTKPTTGYQVNLPDSIGLNWFRSVNFFKWRLVLSKSNSRTAICIACMNNIPAGTGVYHQMFHANGYLHLDCAKQMIKRHGNEFGFYEGPLSMLQACSYQHGKWTAEDVIKAIRPIDAMPVVGD